MSIGATIKTVPGSIPVPISARGTIGNCAKISVSDQRAGFAMTIGWDAREAWRLIDGESNDWDLRRTVGHGVTAKVE